MKINVLKFNEKLFFLTILLLTVVVRVRYADASFERDEGEYAYAGWQILRGGIPYADFYNMKLPGVYAIYALIFRIFGASVVAVRGVLMFVNLISAFFIFKIGERFQSGWLAASIFLLLSLSYEGQGMIANSEHFVVLFAMAGLFFLYRKTTYFTLILSGILLSMSFLMKQHAVFFAMIAMFYLLKNAFKNALTKNNIKSLIFTTLSFSIGYAIPLSILMIFMIQKGVYENFQFLTFEYAAAYSSWFSPSLKYISNFKFIFADNIGFWLLFFTTIYFIFKKKHTVNFHYNLGRDLTIVFSLSFLAVCPGWHFRPHYFQLIFPFAALLMAYGWTVFDFKINYGAIRLSKFNLLGLSLFLSISMQFNYFFIYSPQQFIRSLYSNEFFTETREIGNFLKQNTHPNDKIGMYGNEPQIWFYAQRQAASAYLYAYPLTETQPFAAQMTEQFITETEQSKPEWFIYSNISKGESNKMTLLRLENWYLEFSKKYAVKGVLYQKTKTEGEMKWGDMPIDTTRKVLMVVLRKTFTF